MCISASPNRDALFLCPDFIGGIPIRKRNNRVVVHLNDAELSKLEQDTATTGICREKHIRLALMGITIHPRPPNNYGKVLQQLSAYGNNLNQIAHVVNPENEYAPLVQELGGEVVNISVDSATHFNPLDFKYDKATKIPPYVAKAEFVLSLCEQIMGKEHILAGDKSLIDDALENIYGQATGRRCWPCCPPCRLFHSCTRAGFPCCLPQKPLLA